MMGLLIFALVLIFSWGVGSLVAWYDYRMYYYAPFNWRLFFGPVVYINWAEVKEDEGNANDR